LKPGEEIAMATTWTRSDFACAALVPVARAALPAIALLVAAAPPAEAARRKECRRRCEPAVAACVQAGGRRSACRRRLVRRCTREATTCPVGGPGTTTTTIPTAVPAVDLAVTTVETLYELGTQVAAAGTQFVRVVVDVVNRDAPPFSPTTFTLYTDGLGHLPSPYSYPPPTGDALCAWTTVLPPGRSIACTLVFQVRQGSASGEVTLGSYGPTGGVVAATAVDIPVVPRPGAVLEVQAVVDRPGCTVRPGFRVVEIALALASHDGASGLTLGGPFSIVVDGARYLPAYCAAAPDACDYRIGVPVDGAASCTTFFEVPAGATTGSLEIDDGRYRAAAAVALP
jgi:hypothetical protein